MTNEEIIQKAVITTDALANGGALPPEQASEFITTLVDLTELKGVVRVVRFKPETLQIDKIGVGQRVTVPKSEARTIERRRGVTTSKVELTPKEQMTPFEISDDFPDQNIEGEKVIDTVIRLMATQTANDLEELYINGQTTGVAAWESDMYSGGSSTQVVKDQFLAQFNGWLKLADSGNSYDAEGANISLDIFNNMILQMPKKFRRVRRNLRFMASLDHDQLYRAKFATRQTAEGDASAESSKSRTPFGIPLVGIPLLDSQPIIVDHVTLGAHSDTQSLSYAPIGQEVIVCAQTLDNTPITPAVETTDYVLDRTNGTITTTAAGAYSGGGAIKVTYPAYGQMLLTDYNNLILGIGRDVRIEKDRDIYAGVDQYAITTKVAVQIEETEAVVKGINIGMA
jgi:hypothetical protein